MIGRGGGTDRHVRAHDAAGVEFLATSLFKHPRPSAWDCRELPKHRLLHAPRHSHDLHRRYLLRLPEVVRRGRPVLTLTRDGRGGLLRTQETDLLHAIEKALGINQVRLITTGGDALKPSASSGRRHNNVLTIARAR